MRTILATAFVLFGCDSGDGESKSIWDFVPETYDLSAHPAAVQECIALGLTFNARVDDCGGLGQEPIEVQLEVWADLCQPGLPPPGARDCGSIWANGTCAEIEAACCVMWNREHECSMVAWCKDAKAQGRPTNQLCEDMGL